MPLLLAALAATVASCAFSGIASGQVQGSVAYTREWRDAEAGQSYWGISVADLTGQGGLEITGRPPVDTGNSPAGAWEAYDPVWSPDGSRLAFVRTGQAAGVYVVNRDGSGMRRVLRSRGLTLNGAISEAEYPAWSPDGRRIAFGSGSLLVVNRDGTGERRLVASYACNPVWSYDGRSLAYLSRAGDGSTGCTAGDGLAGDPGYHALYTVDADGTHRRRLATGSFGNVAWAPSRSWIAYTDHCSVHHSGPAEWYCGSVQEVRPDGSGARTLLTTPQIDWVRWAMSGTQLLWQARDGGPVRATTVSTGQTRRIGSGEYFGGISHDSNRVGTFSEYPQRLFVASLTSDVKVRVAVPRGWRFHNASVYLR